MYRTFSSPLFLLFTATLFTSCTASGPTTRSVDQAEAFPPPLERQVNPFEVRDGEGQIMNLPFLGGLNVPRPQFVDIDGDGDDDLFLQEMTGQLMFLEHERDASGSRFIWKTDRYDDMPIGEWSRFYDMDGDGDFDLLTEQPFSYIRYYRNDGGSKNPEFTLVADTLLDARGEPLFADRQNIPNLTDIDCDGLPDLFIGRVEGTVMRYEAVEKVTDGPPRFRLVSDRFENIEIIGQIGSMHGANTLDFHDYDGDNDQDLFWGDFFEPGLLLIENTGTCQEPVLQGVPVPFPREAPISTSGYNAPAFSDINDDGIEDLLVGVLGGAFNPNLTSADNFYYLTGEGNGQFDLETQRFVPTIDVGRESIPAFADMDADGDLDLILSNKIEPTDFDLGRSYYFENTGTAAAPAFQLVDTLVLDTTYHNAPAIADLDADGDLDMLLGTWSQGIAFYRNEGSPESPKLVAENTSYLKLTRGSNSTPSLVDIDADGDLDLFIGESSGTINFYQNDGTATDPKFTLISDEYLDIDAGRRSIPTFADLDQDGDFDMIIGREALGLVYYRNDGTPQAPAFVLDDSLNPTVPSVSAPAFVDIDADGDLDFFSGGDGGGLYFYMNRQKD